MNLQGARRGMWTVAALVFAGVLALLISTRAKRRHFNVRALPDAPFALADFNRLASFSLVDQEGREFTRNNLFGRVWIVDLVFTRCAGQCPLMQSRVARLLSEISDNRIGALSISVDPAHDTPEALRAYAQRLKADTSRWTFVTGSAPTINALAKEGLRLSGDSAEPAAHSTRLVLLDREARVRGYYDSEDDGALERLRRDIAAVLAEKT